MFGSWLFLPAAIQLAEPEPAVASGNSDHSQFGLDGLLHVDSLCDAHGKASHQQFPNMAIPMPTIDSSGGQATKTDPRPEYCGPFFAPNRFLAELVWHVMT
jgi:hypothetical protein